MQRGYICSALLHLAVILLAVLGLPHLVSPPPQIEEPIPVEVMTIAEKTSPPKAEPKPEPKPEPPKKVAALPPAPPLPEPPKPEPQKVETPTPPPPKPEVAAPAPPPVPEPEPVPQPKPEKKVEPKPVEAQAPAPLVQEPPKLKPKPPQQTTVDQILKSVEKIKPQPQPDKADQVIKEFAQASAPPPASLDNKMTISEIDAVRRQIERCWNVPAGAKDAKNLVVEIHVIMNPDGSVRQAAIVDQSRMQSDTFFRAAAESAYRAIYLCQPLKLPPDKYSLWQDMTLSFNPSQIL